MALFRRKNPKDGDVPIQKRAPKSPVLIGGIVLAILLLVVFAGFYKKNPFAHPFQLKAVFANANSLKPGFQVRIAGVNVGKVDKVEAYQANPRLSLVTMQIDQDGLPIHSDASLKIRPRLFLEGNFFVDVKPGSPEAPDLDSGDTIPMAQTAAPVQFGDVLSALRYDDRLNLQQLLIGYGGALTRTPDALDERTADPRVRGLTAAQALNGAARDSAPAFRDAAIVNDALLGERPHDLSTIIRSVGGIARALDAHERQLGDLVVNFNTTMAAFASESGPLRDTIRLLSPTLDVATRTFDDLNASFPPTRRFALALIPAVHETGPTIDAAGPWIRQTRALLGPSELRGLAAQLSPATRDLAQTIDATTRLLPQQNLAALCLTKVVLPTGDIKIQDPSLAGYSPVQNYKEFWYTMVGLAGETQNFDGNGGYTRFQTGGGTQSISVGQSSLSGDTLFGSFSRKSAGTRPAYPGRRPPYKPYVPCYTQKLPDLNAAATGSADGSQATARGNVRMAPNATQKAGGR